MKTRQKLFDNALLGIRKQGHFAYQAGSCRYRTIQGYKCGIGQSIPDEAYDRKMEGFGVDGLSKENDVIRDAAGIGDDDRSFARDLQAAHDRAATNFEGDQMAQFEDRMQALALKYKLVWTAK